MLNFTLIVTAYVVIYRIPNAKSSIAFQLVAVWKDTLAAHWVVVVMSKSINYYSNRAFKKENSNDSDV